MIYTPAYNLLIYRSGGTVITTCSPHNFELVKSLGADLAVDYKSLTAVSDIKDSTGNQLSLVLDCIGVSSGERICYDSFGPSGGVNMQLLSSPRKSGVRRLNISWPWRTTLLAASSGSGIETFLPIQSFTSSPRNSGD